MLATPLILFESPFSRVMSEYFPWMNIINSEGPRYVLDTIVISDGLAIIFALALYVMNRKRGAPWLIASGFMALQAVATWFAPDMPLIGSAFGAYASVPPAITLALGVAAGAATAWLGWEAGKPQPKRAPATA
jgi:hypothetical protein